MKVKVGGQCVDFIKSEREAGGRRMRLLGMASCAASDATAGGNAKLKTCSSARASSQLHSSPSSSL